MTRDRRRRLLLGIGAVGITLVAGGALIQLIWNLAAAALFGLPPLAFVHALAIAVVIVTGALLLLPRVITPPTADKD